MGRGNFEFIRIEKNNNPSGQDQKGQICAYNDKGWWIFQEKSDNGVSFNISFRNNDYIHFKPTVFYRILIHYTFHMEAA